MSNLPNDHEDRMDLLHTSLSGLSVGDAFGQQFFFFPEYIGSRTLPEPTWYVTDDTIMAIAIASVLRHHGTIDQDVLARVFAAYFVRDPERGYGAGAQRLLRMIHGGDDWREVASGLFGEGSYGNGAAMRVAPLGAYFHDDLERVVHEARLSSEVTHAHPEGIAGGIAVAVAAAMAASDRDGTPHERGRRLIETVLEHTPGGVTRDGIERSLAIELDASPLTAAGALGNGDQITAMDTVPFVVWSAAASLDDFPKALWRTVMALGDRDTTCAMVGGIVVLSTGADAIPEEWLHAREPLPTV